MKMTGRTGRPIKNQEIIRTPEGAELFVSYGTPIARRDPDGRITLDARYWDYSVTTGRYRNQFLGELKAQTEKKLDSGEYLVADLS